MKETDREILELMVSYCKKVDERISRYNITAELFSQDDVLADALLMPVFQIGELAGKLSGDCREELADIPWHAVRGFRNIIAHDYTSIEEGWAWDTITSSIPELEIEISCYLEQDLEFNKKTRDCIAEARLKAQALAESKKAKTAQPVTSKDDPTV